MDSNPVIKMRAEVEKQLLHNTKTWAENAIRCLQLQLINTNSPSKRLKISIRLKKWEDFLSNKNGETND